MFYVVNNHLDNLYVLSNKAVGPGKNPKLINIGPMSMPESRVLVFARDLGTNQKVKNNCSKSFPKLSLKLSLKLSQKLSLKLSQKLSLVPQTILKLSKKPSFPTKF